MEARGIRWITREHTAKAVVSLGVLAAVAGCGKSSVIPCVRPAPFVLSPSTVEIGVGTEVTLERQPNAGYEGCPPRPDGTTLTWSLDVAGVATLVTVGDSSATVRGEAPGLVKVVAALAEDPETEAVARVFVEE